MAVENQALLNALVVKLGAENGQKAYDKIISLQDKNK